MATQKEWLVQAMANDLIFFDMDFASETEAVLTAQAVKAASPEAIVARYHLAEEL